MPKYNTLEEVRDYAFAAHRRVNHNYDEFPYSKHLEDVYQHALRFIHLLPEKDRETALKASYCHDLIEDTRLTYNDLNKDLGEEVADSSYALANEKGKTRKERANAKYYAGIREKLLYIFVKVSDRLGNMSYAKERGSGMLAMYAKELPDFEKELYTPELEEMFQALRNLCFTV